MKKTLQDLKVTRTPLDDENYEESWIKSSNKRRDEKILNKTEEILTKIEEILTKIEKFKAREIIADTNLDSNNQQKKEKNKIKKEINTIKNEIKKWNIIAYNKLNSNSEQKKGKNRFFSFSKIKKFIKRIIKFLSNKKSKSNLVSYCNIVPRVNKKSEVLNKLDIFNEKITEIANQLNKEQPSLRTQLNTVGSQQALINNQIPTKINPLENFNDEKNLPSISTSKPLKTHVSI